MKKTFLLAILLSFSYILSAHAQYASQREASRMIITKVVADFKMGDQEYANDIKALREDARFNEKLQRILGDLSNDKVKNTKTRQVEKILENAGRDIENLLNER